MARKSRKNGVQTAAATVNRTDVFRTAIYARLSKEDTRSSEFCSIETQIELIKQHIDDKPFLELVDCYADNGCTGTNFQRPAFMAMMEEVKKGNINCIVVKDLSRFGREYIEVNNYIEKIFPFLNVRFISVNDNFDTFSPDIEKGRLGISIKTLLHAYYSKNLSHNIQKVLVEKRKNGKFIGTFPPYGYRFVSEEDHSFVPDEETAPNVVKIFQWRLEGLTLGQIADQLNQENIPTYHNYLYQKGVLQKEKFAEKKLWSRETIAGILKNESYLGTLIQGRLKSKEMHKPVYVNDPVQWIIVPDHHVPIVDRKVFDAVQKLRKEAKQKQDSNLGKYRHYQLSENIFMGMVFCGVCGTKVNYVYQVNHYRQLKKRKFYCNSKSPQNQHSIYIPEETLVEAVTMDLKRKAETFIDFEKLLAQMKQKPETVSRIAEIDKNIILAKQNKTRVETRLKALYEDLTENAITKEEYVSYKERYLTDHKAYERQLTELTAAQSKFSDSFIGDNPYKKAITSIQNGFTLNREIIERFIEKVVIYPDKSIEIQYKFKDEYKELIEFAKENGVENHG